MILITSIYIVLILAVILMFIYRINFIVKAIIIPFLVFFSVLIYQIPLILEGKSKEISSIDYLPDKCLIHDSLIVENEKLFLWVTDITEKEKDKIFIIEEKNYPVSYAIKWDDKFMEEFRKEKEKFENSKANILIFDKTGNFFGENNNNKEGDKEKRKIKSIDIRKIFKKKEELK